MPSRRTLLIGGAAAAGGIALGYPQVFPAYGGPVLDAQVAYDQSQTGTLLLIDIRRPDEWAATGSGQGAHRLDLRRDDFIDALTTLLDGDRTRPVALICARGVRSARMANLLTKAGFTRVINIPEGMLGSVDGPGWIARGLPLDRD